ncbi:MAG TPA: hypothetical protein VM925_13295 [Labilithrix sp.]|jgi:hypothetical protein|nr:hypothetical protein [Labilithrix sp.]
MYRFAVLLTLGAAVAIIACGDGNKPPPLTPDSEHPGEAVDGGPSPAPSAAPTSEK